MGTYRCVGCGSCKRVCECTYQAEREQREAELDRQFLPGLCGTLDDRTIVSINFKGIPLDSQREFINVLRGNFPGNVELIDGPESEFDLGDGPGTSYTVHLWLGTVKPDGTKELYYDWDGTRLTVDTAFEQVLAAYALSGRTQ